LYITAWCKRGALLLVYDPFIGSGATALACIDLGINYLGTDIDDENYVNAAIENIAERLSLNEARRRNEPKVMDPKVDQTIDNFY
jgi:DNA modification methylase